MLFLVKEVVYLSEGIIGNIKYVIDIKVSNLDEAEKKTSKLMKMVDKFNVAAKGMVIPKVISIGQQAITAASEYTEAMTKIQQATGATNAQMNATEAVANNLYKENFGKSWEDLGSAISTTMQITNQTGDDLQNTTKNALLLRDAFGYSVTDSVKTADTMMQTFGVTSEQSMGLLAQGAQNGLDQSGKLLETANQYSKPFQELGFTANEMFDTLAAGSNNGALSLDTVGAAIGQFSTLSTNGSDATKKAFESLGLNADQMISTFTSGGPQAKESFSGIMEMLSQIEDPMKRNSIGVALMGDQFKSLDAPIIAAMGTARSQFDMTKDTMEQMNQTNFDSPGEALQGMGRQIETGVLIPLGMMLLPLLQTASDLVGFFIDHIDVLGPALGGVAAVIIGTAIPALWAMIAPLLPIIGIALLVGAAIAGVILIFKNWGTIGPWLSGIWTTFVASTISIFNSVINFFVTWGLVIWGVITGYISNLVIQLAAYWNQIKLYVMQVFTEIWTMLTSIWNNIILSITTSVNRILTIITGVWDTIKSVSADLWNGMSQTVTGMWEGIKSSFITGINWVIGKLNNMITKVNSILNVEIKGFGKLGVSIPTIAMIPNGAQADGSHARGLSNVPFDGYIAELHKGERVMTAAENKAYSSADPARSYPARVAPSHGGVSINVTVPVTVEGGSGMLPNAQNMGAVVAQEVQKILESVLRRNGLGAMG